MKKLKENAVYSDVVDAGLILPRKQKYTLSDVKNLVKSGWCAVDALWIVKCSCAFHQSKISEKIMTDKFFIACEMDLI